MLFLLTNFSFADAFFEENYAYTYLSNGDFRIVQDSEETIIERSVTEIENSRRKLKYIEYQYLKYKDLTIGDDGYSYINIFGDKYIIIFGGGNYIVLYNLSRDKDDFVKRDISKEIILKQRYETFKIGWASLGIKNVNTDSFLVETIGNKKLEYKPENTLKLFYGYHIYGPFWNQYNIPWVEGADCDGIGSKIIVEFYKPEDEIIILNGYVNLLNRKLYKENNRLKKIKIKSLDNNNPFEITATIKDRVKFTPIKLPKKVSKIELEILDVYHGTIYSDTCIAGILAKSKFNEYKEGVLKKFLKGDKIKEYKE